MSDQPSATIINDTLAALPTPLGVLALEYHTWPLLGPPRADGLTVGTRTDLHLTYDLHGGYQVTTELPLAADGPGRLRRTDPRRSQNRRWPSPAFTLSWSIWRRRHQATARRTHYQRQRMKLRL